MKQQVFESRYSDLWLTLEQFLLSPRNDIDQLPQLYRQVCHHFALAKHRHYSPHLVSRLNRLVLGLHHRLYQHNTRYRYQWLRFLMIGFPSALRTNAAFVWVAAALFLVPGVAMWLGCFINEELIYTLMSSAEVNQFEQAYAPGSAVFGRERQSDSDLMMFGFYIKNNIGISFRAFAGGILFGAGSIFFMLYNGVFIGGVAGHIAQVGYIDTFYPFVIGHGAFELTAIVFSGAAGLKLGFSLIAPGPYSRLSALKIAGREAVQIVYGATIMLIIAAFLEAFWSSKSEIAPYVKYSVGALLWLLVLGYCGCAGRRFSRAT